jgi:ABC-type sugar transport system permease subunit
VGSAVAVVLFVVLLVFSVVYVRMIGKEAQA